jgi:hypothetical protein
MNWVFSITFPFFIYSNLFTLINVKQDLEPQIISHTNNTNNSINIEEQMRLYRECVQNSPSVRISIKLFK